ncbi:hypothetical protein [Streptomyces lavendulocolor]
MTRDTHDIPAPPDGSVVPGPGPAHAHPEVDEVAEAMLTLG